MTTALEAVDHSIRLAHASEGETDRQLAEHLATLATLWLDIAWYLVETE